ncbi:hypothetical protein EYC80_007237 [Monilinia laxa]|uniref:Uncharacterized protein n=1 Tax=Monilinia laxa TaxID=61186 RepID=A0A5N6K0K3_MONLA|nr:hypothetical protein EYC80_007237 [Monilinia laxa]
MTSSHIIPKYTHQNACLFPSFILSLGLSYNHRYRLDYKTYCHLLIISSRSLTSLLVTPFSQGCKQQTAIPIRISCQEAK